MAVAGLILIGIGISLILIGAYISLYEWKKEQRRLQSEKVRREEVVTEAASVGEALEGLAMLAEALKKHPLGMQLIIVGITLITIGGLLGGFGSLMSNV
jgi:uncharacterized membrane protein